MFKKKPYYVVNCYYIILITNTLKRNVILVHLLIKFAIGTTVLWIFHSVLNIYIRFVIKLV